MSYRGVLDSRLIRLTASLAVAAATSGCAMPANVAKLNLDIPRDATPVAIEAGLRAMNDPANQQRIQQMVSSPEMKAVERELMSGMVDGSLAALNDTDRAERIGELTSRYATGILQAFSREVAPQIGPAVSELVRSAIRGAMSEALKPDTHAGLAAAISSAMTRDLGPALQRVISENLAGGIAEALQKDEVSRALGETAHLVGREMVLGVNEGMARIQAAKPKGEPSVLGSLESLVNKSSNIAIGITWVLGAVVLVLAGLLARLLMQARKYRSESEAQVAGTRLIAEARNLAEARAGSDELTAARENRFPSVSRASRRGEDRTASVGQ